MPHIAHGFKLIASIAGAGAILITGLLTTTPAAAERLVISISRHQVLVTSNFTGTSIVLFGSVEPDKSSAKRRENYDIVATIRGPMDTVVTRRKSRVLGIWANVDSRTFIKVPRYLAVLANRPFGEIAGSDQLRRLQIGHDYFILPQRIGPDIADVVRDDPFRVAFIRLKSEQGLYVQRTNGMTFLTPTLFRGAVPLPAIAPIGTYEVEVKLLSEGELVTSATSAFELVKVGFEQFIVTAARDHGLLYGLATALMALMTGWFASVVFRRD